MESENIYTLIKGKIWLLERKAYNPGNYFQLHAYGAGNKGWLHVYHS